jgi:alpha-beta hydrolase superfamily lysophospholipase
VKRNVIHRSVVLLTLAFALLLAGCGGGSGSGTPIAFPSQPVTIGPGVTLTTSAFNSSVTTDVAAAVTASPANATDWGKFLTYFSDIIGHGSYDIEMHRMQYLSKRADGSAVTLSGLIILPRTKAGTLAAVPILMYQHATEPYRPNAPSQFLIPGRNPLDYPEVVFAAAMASTGYAVAMPDYEGMGDNTDIQPFVHATTLAGQVEDMLRSTRDALAGKVAFFTAPCTWNGKLFLMGYSEGGFVTMATARDLQLNHAAEFTVTAAAPLSGPHDLSGTMLGVILANTTFKAPYFVPFVLTAYYSVYRDPKLSPDYTMLVPYSTTLPPLLNGNSTGETINTAMGMSYNPVQLIVPRSVLTPQFIADLQSTTSAVAGYLRENDTYRGWAPTVPIRMLHNPNDDLVPFANSQVAFNAFSSAGAKKWVALLPSTDTVNLSSSTVPTVHVAAALPELHDAWQWIFSSF